MEIDYKVENGKLLRIDLELDGIVIRSIRIRGDFFIHPEEKLKDIEDGLKGCNVDDVSEKFREIVDGANIRVIGFGGEDLERALNKGL